MPRSSYHETMSYDRPLNDRQRGLGRIALLVVIITLIGNVVAFSYLRPYGILRDLGTLAKARERIHMLYVEEVDDQKLIDAALTGMAESLGDPNTEYFSAQRLAEFNEHFSGEFTGIGAEVGIQDDRLMIIAPLDDSPAWRSGVLPGDIVLEIDGKDTKGIDIFEAVTRLKGEAGTDVTIKVRHTDGTVEQITITREKIEVASVRGYRRDPGNGFKYMIDPANKIAYVRLTQFAKGSAQEVKERLEQLKAQDMRGLILDLRDNGGGLLEGAVAIADMFLTGGKTIVTTRGRAEPETTLRSSSDTLLPDLPLVVLVNENSASASEIFAGAMLDNGRALIVGTRTYGKGSVQQLLEFGDGEGALKLTTAYWYLPSGQLIHRNEGASEWGVSPSPGCVVPMTSEQVRAMLLKRRNIDIEDPYEDLNEPITPQWVRAKLLDDQLAAALEAAQARVAGNPWPKVGVTMQAATAEPTEREKLVERRKELQTQLNQVNQDLDALDPALNPAGAADPPRDAPANQN